MSLHLAPREGRFKALREEGGIFTGAPSSSAAVFSLLALPTVASLCASPSCRPSLQLSPPCSRSALSQGPLQSVTLAPQMIRAARYQMFRRRGRNARVPPAFLAALTERAGSCWSSRPARRCVL